MSAHVVEVELTTRYRIALDEPVANISGVGRRQIVGFEVDWSPRDGIRRCWLVTRDPVRPHQLPEVQLIAITRHRLHGELTLWRRLILGALRATDTRAMHSR